MCSANSKFFSISSFWDQVLCSPGWPHIYGMPENDLLTSMLPCLVKVLEMEHMLQKCQASSPSAPQPFCFIFDSQKILILKIPSDCGFIVHFQFSSKYLHYLVERICQEQNHSTHGSMFTTACNSITMDSKTIFCSPCALIHMYVHTHICKT